MKLSTLFCLLLSLQAFGQTPFKLTMSPLDISDTINENTRLKKFKNFMSTVDPLTIIAEAKEHPNNVHLLSKIKGKWLVYDMEGRFSISDISKAGRFLVYEHVLGNSLQTSSYTVVTFYIVDPQRRSFCQFIQRDDREEHAEGLQRENETDKQWEKRTANFKPNEEEYSANITLKGDLLSINPTVRINTVTYKEPLKDVIAKMYKESPSGVYKYINGNFIRIKSYKPYFKGVQPVHWIGGVCVGMPLDEFFKLHPHVKKKKKYPPEYIMKTIPKPALRFTMITALAISSGLLMIALLDLKSFHLRFL